MNTVTLWPTGEHCGVTLRLLQKTQDGHPRSETFLHASRSRVNSSAARALLIEVQTFDIRRGQFAGVWDTSSCWCTMAREMVITRVETLRCGAGFRDFWCVLIQHAVLGDICNHYLAV